MSKYVMAITYLPKIDPIRSGNCNQTIRKGIKFKIGDSVLLHGWAGLPYRSRWSWRKRIIISDVINIDIDEIGFQYIKSSYHTWDSAEADRLAARDFIDPPTGIELSKILFKLNKTEPGFTTYQIIRW